jgi:hypothetical protein
MTNCYGNVQIEILLEYEEITPRVTTYFKFASSSNKHFVYDIILTWKLTLYGRFLKPTARMAFARKKANEANLFLKFFVANDIKEFAVTSNKLTNNLRASLQLASGRLWFAGRQLDYSNMNIILHINIYITCIDEVSILSCVKYTMYKVY